MKGNGTGLVLFAKPYTKAKHICENLSNYFIRISMPIIRSCTQFHLNNAIK